MKRILAMIFGLCLSYDSLACQYAANENELEGARKDRAQMKELIAELAEQADSIFIGSIKSKGDYSFTFQDIVNIKGKTKEGSKFIWEQTNEIVIGCSGVTDIEHFFVPDEDYEQGSLVYVKGNQILRMNLVSSFADQPTGYEEIEWLSK